MPFTRISSGFLMMLGTVWTTLRVAENPSIGIAEWQKAVRRARKGAALFTDPLTHLRVMRVLGRREVQRLYGHFEQGHQRLRDVLIRQR